MDQGTTPNSAKMRATTRKHATSTEQTNARTHARNTEARKDIDATMSENSTQEALHHDRGLRTPPLRLLSRVVHTIASILSIDPIASAFANVVHCAHSFYSLPDSSCSSSSSSSRPSSSKLPPLPSSPTFYASSSFSCSSLPPL